MKRLLSILLTTIFLSHIVCTTMCLHSHMVDGQLITHSHPYSTQNHQHSASSIAAFGNVQHSVFNTAEILTISAAQYILLSTIAIANSDSNTTNDVVILATRAPPAC